MPRAPALRANASPAPVSGARGASVLLVLLVISTVGASAQSDLTLEFGASHIGPAIGMEGDAAQYLMAGLRGGHYGASGSGIRGSVLFGRTLDVGTAGSFLSGMIEGSLVDQWHPSVSGALDLRALGYGSQEPFPYRAFAVEGGPSVRIRTPRLSVELEAIGGLGTTQLELWRVEGGRSRVFEDDLWRGGSRLEVLVGPVTSAIGMAGGWHRTPSGDYGNVGARLLLAGRWGVAELRADRWSTPFGDEIVGGLALVVPLGTGWSLRGFFGRTDPDPLTLAQPTSGGAGVLVGRSVLPASRTPQFATGPWEIVSPGDATSLIRLTVAPEGAPATVQVMGDFTFWEPLDMERDADQWAIEIDVPNGTHHYGFLVDGEWHLPPDTPDLVPDEWGRMSATLVVDGASR